MTWQDHANCRGMGADAFFPATGNDAPRIVAEAKQVCAGCEVRDECRAAGLMENFGIWGGTTENERRVIRRPRVMPAHGTSAMYRRGCRCQHCRWAHSESRRGTVGWS